MKAATGIEAPARAEARAPVPAAFASGTQVVLRRPWRLRGSRAIVRRRLPAGWEVEVRTALGTPMHLVLPARALRRA